MTPSVRTLQGSKTNGFQGSTSLCPRGSNAHGFSNPLPISANYAADARIHYLRHMDNSMQVVWHKTELENANSRIVPAHHI